jgi:hypothetical protein
VCSPNAERCNNNTPQICSSTGTWQNETSQCSSPSTICEVQSDNAACVSNPPYDVGEASPLGDSTSIPTNWLLGIWVDVPHRARIVSFGLWATGQGPRPANRRRDRPGRRALTWIPSIRTNASESFTLRSRTIGAH